MIALSVQRENFYLFKLILYLKGTLPCPPRLLSLPTPSTKSYCQIPPKLKAQMLCQLAVKGERKLSVEIYYKYSQLLLSEGRLPPTWKKANVVPVPKEKPIKDVNKDLRQISLTPILSKVAEDFVLKEFLKPATLKEIDETQFGSIPKFWTTQALVSIVYKWTKHTDGNGSTVRGVHFVLRMPLI